MRAAISGLVWTTAAVSDSTKKPSSLAMLSMRAIAVTIAQLAEETTGSAHRTAELSLGLSETAKGQFSLVERFNR